MSQTDRHFDWHELMTQSTAQPPAPGTRQRLQLLLLAVASASGLVMLRAVQLELTGGPQFRAEAIRPITPAVRCRPIADRFWPETAAAGSRCAVRTSLALHYRWLQQPADPDWLRRQATGPLVASSAATRRSSTSAKQSCYSARGFASPPGPALRTDGRPLARPLPARAVAGGRNCARRVNDADWPVIDRPLNRLRPSSKPMPQRKHRGGRLSVRRWPIVRPRGTGAPRAAGAGRRTGLSLARGRLAGRGAGRGCLASGRISRRADRRAGTAAISGRATGRARRGALGSRRGASHAAGPDPQYSDRRDGVERQFEASLCGTPGVEVERLDHRGTSLGTELRQRRWPARPSV